jgi:hypothetical protein
MKKIHIKLLVFVFLISCAPQNKTTLDQGIKISENHRYFTTKKGDPFFWLGDTGWLLFTKLNREDAEKYFDNRVAKGFNVIQVMVLHDLNHAVNIYGDSALINHNIANPKTTEGNLFTDSAQYDFWDHVDYLVDLAAKKGIYMALVPIWGSNVKGGRVSVEQAKTYASWLANRYKNKPNIIWLNGGDIKGSDSLNVWNAIGNTINQIDTNHLITFHPRGRMQSSMWFQNEHWLKFNMFQSGHRSYAQDTSSEELCYGEDNWKYINVDYNLTPIKPTLDGEPSYEDIPQGLHDTLQPRWTDNDIRRYAYWSIFAGASGFTYGHNSVMQFFKATEKKGAYGAKKIWDIALNDPGAGQLIHLKNLMLSRPYFERIPYPSIISAQGEKYNYLAATRGKTYAFIYTYTGRDIPVNMGKIEGKKVKASWFNPKDGKTTEIGTFDNTGSMNFNPPGEQKNGNDWVLILDKI